MTRFSDSERVIPHDVGTQDHVNSKGERQAGQSVASQVDRRSRGDLDGPEIKMRESGR